MRAKRMMTAAALSMGLGLASVGAPLPGDSAAAKPKADEEDTSRRVCRNLTPSGTRLTTRVCRTQAEWAKSMDKTQDSVLQQQIETTTQLRQAPRP